MNNLKTFDLNIGTVILRFYLMMAVVIIAGFSGYWLMAFMALPIFLSIMLGISFKKKSEDERRPCLRIMRNSATTQWRAMYNSKLRSIRFAEDNARTRQLLRCWEAKLQPSTTWVKAMRIIIGREMDMLRPAHPHETRPNKLRIAAAAAAKAFPPK